MGCGDELAVLASEPLNCRFIDSLEPVASQLDIARMVVKNLNKTRGSFFSVQGGTATKLPFPCGQYDRVVAIDCAYHFRTRRAFLLEANRVLKSGGSEETGRLRAGRIGTVDLAFDWDRVSWPFALIGRFVGSWVAGIPVENQLNVRQLVASFRESGFETDIVVHDISLHVFPGLLMHLEAKQNALLKTGKKSDLSIRALWLSAFALRLFALLLYQLFQAGVLSCVTVTATKGKPAKTSNKLD